jgi:hypothetical protein
MLKTFCVIAKRNTAALTIIACLLVAGSLSAFAVPPPQVARSTQEQTITAQCCVLFGYTVRVTEPATVTPVIVTWSSDYIIRGSTLFGLSLNQGPCKFYGPAVGENLVQAPGSISQFISGTFQWVLLPSDGLAQGVNTFTVCGGGANQSLATTIGNNTLAVQIGK